MGKINLFGLCQHWITLIWQWRSAIGFFIWYGIIHAVGWAHCCHRYGPTPKLPNCHLWIPRDNNQCSTVESNQAAYAVAKIQTRNPLMYATATAS